MTDLLPTWENSKDGNQCAGHAKSFDTIYLAAIADRTVRIAFKPSGRKFLSARPGRSTSPFGLLLSG